MLKFRRLEEYKKDGDNEFFTISFASGIPLDIWRGIAKVYGNPLLSGGFFGAQWQLDSQNSFSMVENNGKALFFEDYEHNRTYFKYSFDEKEILNLYSRLSDKKFSIAVNVNPLTKKDISKAWEGGGISLKLCVLNVDEKIVYEKYFEETSMDKIGEITDEFVKNLPFIITEPTNYSHVITLGSKSNDEYEELLSFSSNNNINFTVITKNVILAYDSCVEELELYLKSKNINYSIDNNPAVIASEKETSAEEEVEDELER